MVYFFDKKIGSSKEIAKGRELRAELRAEGKEFNAESMGYGIERRQVTGFQDYRDLKCISLLK
jgi:hypothetical protein